MKRNQWFAVHVATIAVMAGYGEVMGPEPDTTMKCPDCPSAYEMQDKGKDAIP